MQRDWRGGSFGGGERLGAGRTPLEAKSLQAPHGGGFPEVRATAGGQV